MYSVSEQLNQIVSSKLNTYESFDEKKSIVSIVPGKPNKVLEQTGVLLDPQSGHVILRLMPYVLRLELRELKLPAID